MVSRRLVPVGPFGHAVFELLKRKRRDDGSTWEAEDLAKRVEVSAKQVREWVKGVTPRGDTLLRVAEVFGVDPGALLRGEINPINLPAAPRTPGAKPPVPRALPIDRALRIFEAELELADARGEALPREKARELYQMLKAAIAKGSDGRAAAEAG